jgi:hypothetical protein
MKTMADDRIAIGMGDVFLETVIAEPFDFVPPYETSTYRVLLSPGNPAAIS